MYYLRSALLGQLRLLEALLVRRRVGQVAALRHREEALLAHRPQPLVFHGGQHGLQFGLQLALLRLHLLSHVDWLLCIGYAALRRVRGGDSIDADAMNVSHECLCFACGLRCEETRLIRRLAVPHREQCSFSSASSARTRR